MRKAFVGVDLPLFYSQLYQMVGLFFVLFCFCKYTSSRIEKAQLIAHGSWSYQLRQAVSGQCCWLVVCSKEALKESSWVLQEASKVMGKHYPHNGFALSSRTTA